MDWKRPEWSIEPGFFFHLALLMIFLPFQWVTGFLVAAAVHELGHAAMLKLLKCRILSVRLCTFGAVISTESLTGGREFLCALAGPACGMLLLTVAKWFPVVSICALFQSVYNLLPVYPSDGARILSGLSGMLLPEKSAGALCTCVEILVLAGLLAISIWTFAVWKTGPAPLALSLWLLFLSVKQK